MKDDPIRTRLREALARRGMSARQASLRAGLSASALGNYLRGNSDTLNHSTLVALAAALDTDIVDLISDTETDKTSNYSVPSAENVVDEDIMWAVLRALEAGQRRIAAAQERLSESQDELASEMRRIRDALEGRTKK